MTAPIDAVSGLVEELRTAAHDPDTPDNVVLKLERAADALEPQARELAEARSAWKDAAEGWTLEQKRFDALLKDFRREVKRADEAQARITALEDAVRVKNEAWAYDFVAGWHERQAKLFRDMADDEPRTAKQARDRAKEAATHHAASAVALRNRASDERRTALAKGQNALVSGREDGE